MGLEDIFLSSPDTLSLLLFSLILSGRPPSPPARHSVGSSSFSSSSRVAARGQTGSHHHIQTTLQALINSKQGRQCLELNQTLCNRITISYCVDDYLRLRNPPHLEQGTGAEEEEAAWSQEAATGQSEFGVMMPQSHVS